MAKKKNKEEYPKMPDMEYPQMPNMDTPMMPGQCHPMMPGPHHPMMPGGGMYFYCIPVPMHPCHPGMMPAMPWGDQPSMGNPAMPGMPGMPEMPEQECPYMDEPWNNTPDCDCGYPMMPEMDEEWDC